MKNHVIYRFFHSLAFKIYSAVTICILTLLLLNWLLNSFAFNTYYRKQQQTILVSTFQQMDSLSSEPDTFFEYLKHTTTTSDLSVLVWNDYQVLFSSQQHLSGNHSLIVVPSPNPLKLENGTCTITDRAPPLGNQKDRKSLTLYGRTTGGINTMLQLPLSDVEKTTAIANRFLLWSAIATLLISFVALALLVRSLTKPIFALSAMAKRMASLDFSDRYPGQGSDELAELGNSLNTMSETMETTLAELKTANIRLLNDVEKGERQDQARRSFISNVSHELKTPIALIQSYSEALQENVSDDPESRDFYCKVIEDEAQRLSQMISRMTMLMQLESGKEELQIDRFDIRHLWERLLDRYSPLFQERDLSVPDLPDAPAFVWGDAQLIENVMTNFLTNALHHVNVGGIIRVNWENTDNGTLCISVFNSGSSIPEDELSRVWESFYKIDKARTRSYGGTGIGLSVVAAIMQVHRMPYGVRNLHDGVEFFIELPLK